MKRVVFPILILFSVLLASCQGAEQVSQVPTTETVSAETPTTEPTEVADTSVEQRSPTDAGLKSECTLISSVPEPDPEIADLFTVTEKDWASGPEDAAVTLIEYGDFQ